MSELSLLGPSARPMVQLGGGIAWKQRVIKGVHCTFQWLDLRPHGFDNTPEHAAVPCMVLFRPDIMEVEPFVIPQQHAYRFGDRAGNPTAHLFTSAFDAVDALGFDKRDRSAYKAIIDIIIEALPDLILMPSDPPEGSDAALRRTVIGIEATAKINGKTLREEVL